MNILYFLYKLQDKQYIPHGPFSFLLQLVNSLLLLIVLGYDLLWNTSDVETFIKNSKDTHITTTKIRK